MIKRPPNAPSATTPSASQAKPPGQLMRQHSVLIKAKEHDVRASGTNFADSIDVPGHGKLVISTRFSAGMFGPVYHAFLSASPSKQYVAKSVAVRDGQPHPFEEVVGPNVQLEQLRLDDPYEEIRVLKYFTDKAPHDNIVKQLVAVHTEQSFYTILEWAGDAIDLQQRGDSTHEGRLTLKRLAERKDVFRQIVLGVSHLHHHGYCHLDLSLENVCAFRDPARNKALSVKIIDFGLARKFSADGFGAAAAVKVKNLPGKIAYMAPELTQSTHDGEVEIDGAAADMWSCGVLLLYLCAPPDQTHYLWNSADETDFKYKALLQCINDNSLEPLAALVKELRVLSTASQSFAVSKIALGLFNPKPKRRMKHEELKDIVTDVYAPDDTPWIDLPEGGADVTGDAQPRAKTGKKGKASLASYLTVLDTLQYAIIHVEEAKDVLDGERRGRRGRPMEPMDEEEKGARLLPAYTKLLVETFNVIVQAATDLDPPTWGFERDISWGSHAPMIKLRGEIIGAEPRERTRKQEEFKYGTSSSSLFVWNVQHYRNHGAIKQEAHERHVDLCDKVSFITREEAAGIIARAGFGQDWPTFEKTDDVIMPLSPPPPSPPAASKQRSKPPPVSIQLSKPPPPASKESSKEERRTSLRETDKTTLIEGKGRDCCSLL